MHDKNGTPLQLGDLVLIPARIVQLAAGEDFCNVSLETTHGRRPDSKPEYIGAINTAVLVFHERKVTD